jgi:hypothetical protein
MGKGVVLASGVMIGDGVSLAVGMGVDGTLPRLQAVISNREKRNRGRELILAVFLFMLIP